jgi:O-succinylhomoserine sulfhydrylase
MLFCETPSNPLLEVADLRKLADIARRSQALLVVDNTFCTPWGQTPVALGADLVVHSAGKYIDGQGRCVGGAVVGPLALIQDLRNFMRCAGPSLSPHSAWIFLKGLETLELRMRHVSESAQRLAEWLSGHPRVAKVYYTGLATHPQHALACRQQYCHGGVLAFEVYGDRSEAWACVDAMRMISRTANVGDTKTTVTHPASTTHASLTPEERQKAGLTESLIRVTVGLEDVYDIATDLDRGLLATS